MYKIISRLIMLLLLFHITGKADQVDNMAEMAINEMKQDPEMTEIIACLGVSKTKFYEVFKKTMRYCFEKHADEESTDDQIDRCFDSQTAQGLKVNTLKVTECENATPEDSKHSVEVENNDFDNMSEEEIKQQMQQQQQQAGLDELEKAMKMVKAMSQGTESQITLPIYSPSEIVSHFTNEEKSQKKSEILPVAMFQSNDSVAKIAAFYDKELSHFNKKSFEGGMVVYMENMPKSFDPANDMESYQRSEHVTIFSTKDPSNQQKTVIEIAYSK